MAHGRALIYTRGGKHNQRDEIQVQRDASWLSKYSYIKGNGHQEVAEQRGSMRESSVQKSGMSHSSYRKQAGERNRNTFNYYLSQYK